MWKVGNKVQFKIGWKKYCGIVVDVASTTGLVYVEFVAGYKGGVRVTSREYFREDQLSRYSTRTNTFLFCGEVADFITERCGIRPGVVVDTGENDGEEWFDFGYYQILSDGSMTYTVEKKVARERLIYIHPNMDEMKILPVRRYARVEFDSMFAGRTKGKIIDIYGSFDLPLFEISYHSCAEDGEKEVEIDDEVTIDKIFLK